VVGTVPHPLGEVGCGGVAFRKWCGVHYVR